MMSGRVGIGSIVSRVVRVWGWCAGVGADF